MIGGSVFDYGFFDHFSKNESWVGAIATPNEQTHSPSVLGSGGFSNKGNSLNINGDPFHFNYDSENDNLPLHSGLDMAAVATSVASASINSTLSVILGNDPFSSASFSNETDMSEGSDFSGNGKVLSHNASFGNSSPFFGPTFPEGVDPGGIIDMDQNHVDDSALLKLASSVIPENFRKLSTNSRNCVIAYVILFCIGAPGNLFVFISVGREIWRRQLMRSRIKVLIWHLATADLFVMFVVIPIEVFWRLTIQWYGGDVLCKMAQFFRAFGLYLSSMVIICISLDRFFAIVFPLKVIGGMKRVRNMLWIAWSSSALFAAPQILVFSVQQHPIYPSFLLCSNSDYFLSLSKEIMYNLLSLVVMYFAPLLVILITYAIVLYTIAIKSREHHEDSRPRSGSNQLRRSDNASNITRARRKTLWLSMVIVTVWTILWTPYCFMTIWYMFDYETADKMVDPRIHEAFFVTAVSNSCVNPIIYGNYMKKYWRNLRNAACRSRNSSTSSSRIVSSSRPHHHSHHHHHRHNSHNHHGSVSTHRCGNPNHHFTLSPRCQSTTNTSDVTIVLKEFPSCQLASRCTATSTAVTTTTSTALVSNPTRANWNGNTTMGQRNHSHHHRRHLSSESTTTVVMRAPRTPILTSLKLYRAQQAPLPAQV